MRLLLLIMVCAVTSCSNTKNEEFSSNTIGKYLYMTDDAILHTSKNCVGLRLAKNEDGHRVFGMNFIDTTEFCPNYEYSFCTRCFDDASYERVLQISARNSTKTDTVK